MNNREKTVGPVMQEKGGATAGIIRENKLGNENAVHRRRLPMRLSESSSPREKRSIQVSRRPNSTRAAPTAPGEDWAREASSAGASSRAHRLTSSASEFCIKSQCTDGFQDRPAWQIQPGQAKCKDPKATASVQVAAMAPSEPRSTAA